MNYSALCLSLYGFGKRYQVYLFIATFWLPCLSLLNVIQCMNCVLIKVLMKHTLSFQRIESRIKWVKKHENLIVLRTFSQRAGM
jgi:hypothetical protein